MDDADLELDGFSNLIGGAILIGDEPGPGDPTHEPGIDLNFTDLQQLHCRHKLSLWVKEFLRRSRQLKVFILWCVSNQMFPGKSKQMLLYNRQSSCGIC